MWVPNPQGSSADSLAPVSPIRGTRNSQPHFLPPSTLRFLLLPTLSSYSLGNPPPKRTVSQREVEASPPPPHVHTATVSIATAPPSRRGGPSLSWFPATRQFSV